MSVIASNRFRLADEETVLSCTLPGQAHMNTDPTVFFTVQKPSVIELSGLTSSEKQIPRNCWKH